MTAGPYGIIIYTQRHTMSHIVAFILGIVAATVGFQGVAKIADQGVQKIQEITVETTK